MERSTERILTTHVGSLARPVSLLDIMKEKENGRPYDKEVYAGEVKAAVADRVRQQVECGIDIVTDGEMSKVMFVDYVKDRLAGYEEDDAPKSQPSSWQVEIDMFPEYYADYMKKYSSTVARRKTIVATGPISYVGHDLLKIDIDNLKAAVDGLDVTEIFMPSNGPSGFGENRYYPNREEYVQAVAEAMREEYLGIVDAGFILQIDDPWLIGALSDPTKSIERHASRLPSTHVEILNHALRGISQRQDPPSHVLRVEPRSTPDRHRAEGRHEVRLHDQRRRLLVRGDEPSAHARVAPARRDRRAGGQDPDPRAAGACQQLRRAPRADRRVHLQLRSASSAQENVIAGADCGFSSRASYAPEVHPTVVWPKFKALAEGARIASARLWK